MINPDFCQNKENSVGAIIVAAGSGKRMKGTGDKLFFDLGGISVLAQTLLNFERAREISEIILVVNPKIIKKVESQVVSQVNAKKIVAIVEGGVRRQDSVFNGLKAFPDPPEIVLVHDGDRPFISPDLIDEIACRASSGSVVVAIPARDTIKKVEKGVISETIDREIIWQAQTPQAFPYQELLVFSQQALEEGWEVTDDASIMEKAGKRVEVLMGSPDNIKITTPADREIAKAIYRSWKK